MSISVGDRIPDVTLRVVTEAGADPVASADLLGSGRVVLFAVPGAFTPTCSNVHLPSYVETASDLSAAGVDRIVMLLCGAQNLREITLFPMNQRAEDLLMGAPSVPENKQLRELHLRVVEPPKAQ